MVKQSIKHKLRIMVNPKNTRIGRGNTNSLLFYLDGRHRDVCCLIIFIISLYIFNILLISESQIRIKFLKKEIKSVNIKYLKIFKTRGAPGWLSQLSVRLWLRSGSRGLWVQAPHWALC